MSFEASSNTVVAASTRTSLRSSGPLGANTERPLCSFWMRSLSITKAFFVSISLLFLQVDIISFFLILPSNEEKLIKN